MAKIIHPSTKKTALVTKPTVIQGDGIDPKPKKHSISKRTRNIIIVCVAVSALCTLTAVVFTSKVQDARKKQAEYKSITRDSVVFMDDAKLASLANDPNKKSDIYVLHAKAIASAQKGDKEAALAAYKTLIDTGKATSDMYVDYALTVLSYGNTDLAVSLLQNAIDHIKADKSLSNDQKETAVKQLESKIKWIKLEASNAQ